MLSIDGARGGRGRIGFSVFQWVLATKVFDVDSDHVPAIGFFKHSQRLGKPLQRYTKIHSNSSRFGH